MPVVTFLPSYRKTTVAPGTTILDAARQAGFQMNVVCGGQGKCGKCTVYVKAGEAGFDREKFGKFFTPEELDEGACLSCQALVAGDLQVLIPESTLIQEQKILIESLGLETASPPRSGSTPSSSSPRPSTTHHRISPASSTESKKKGGLLPRRSTPPSRFSTASPESSGRVGGG